jgi:hypothetical protein
MPGLDTRTGRRNVKKGFTTDYTPKVGYQPAKDRTYGYGSVQTENPVADDGYGSMNFGSNTQSLMSQISGFQASRPQPKPQFDLPSESSPVSYSSPSQYGGTGSQSNPYAMPQPQFQLEPQSNASATNSYSPGSRAKDPAGSIYGRDGEILNQGIVAKPGGGGYTNYGTTNYGTRRVYNAQTRQWETKRIVDPQGRLEGE